MDFCWDGPRGQPHRLEIGVYRKGVLLHKHGFNGGDVVLFVKQQHRFFVIERVYGAKR